MYCTRTGKDGPFSWTACNERRESCPKAGELHYKPSPKDDAPLISTDTTSGFEWVFCQTRIELHAAQGLSPASRPSRRASTIDFDESSSEAVNGSGADCSLRGTRVSFKDVIEMSRACSTTTTIMPELPQELVDRIIDHVDDRNSLKACSLVSSRWSARSRKYLFVRVEFRCEEDLQRWYACISPGPSWPSSLVEHLTLPEHKPLSTLPCLHPLVLSNAAPLFQSFSALRVLEIWNWRMSTDRVSPMLHSFGSSLENVTHLTLGSVAIYSSTLAM